MIDAKPMHLLRLPGDGWLPFVAAAGTAGFFLLLTVKLTVLAFACGVVAILAILRWLWDLEQPAPAPKVEAADGVWLPVGAVGRQSHSWWAMVVLFAVDMTIFASFVFAHVHVSMALDVCPPPGALLPPLSWPVAAGALLLAGWAAMASASRGIDNGDAKRQRGLRLRVAAAMLLSTAGFGVAIAGHIQAGLDPTAQAWSATIATLLFYQGFHTVVLLFMGGYTLARSWAGKLQPSARASADNTRVMWHCVTLQGVIGLVLVQGLPGLMG